MTSRPTGLARGLPSLLSCSQLLVYAELLSCPVHRCRPVHVAEFSGFYLTFPSSLSSPVDVVTCFAGLFVTKMGALAPSCGRLRLEWVNSHTPPSMEMFGPTDFYSPDTAITSFRPALGITAALHFVIVQTSLNFSSALFLCFVLSTRYGSGITTSLGGQYSATFAPTTCWRLLVIKICWSSIFAGAHLVQFSARKKDAQIAPIFCPRGDDHYFVPASGVKKIEL